MRDRKVPIFISLKKKNEIAFFEDFQSWLVNEFAHGIKGYVFIFILTQTSETLHLS